MTSMVVLTWMINEVFLMRMMNEVGLKNDLRSWSRYELDMLDLSKIIYVVGLEKMINVVVLTRMFYA